MIHVQENAIILSKRENNHDFAAFLVKANQWNSNTDGLAEKIIEGEYFLFIYYSLHPLHNMLNLKLISLVLSTIISVHPGAHFD